MEYPLLNNYQTPITEELLSGLPDEISHELLEIISTVPFIKTLISPTRERAKDRPKDSNGRIIVDLTKPHILENMDYFRPSAIHFKKYGVYNKARPNKNPNSEFGKWLREERNRCWEGMVRPEDGEWIPGPLYFYLNYCPIIQTKIRKGTKQGDRVVDFPEMWEGIYWRFHYMDQSRNGGIYNEFLGGNHGAELASRGKSKSYSMASILAHNFILGENRASYKETRSLVTAYQKEYLIKDGVLNKFVSMADFIAQTTQFPRKRLKSALQDMIWVMGYKDAELNIEKGLQNQVLGVSSKDDESKLRGKRAVFIGIEEFGTFPRLIDLYNVLKPSVQEGDIVFGIMYLQGTAGDSESDFAGAQEIMYNPKGYNMYALPNVFDKENQGKKEFVFFYPGYINRKGYYDENGNSDVIGALISILVDRHKVKYNSTDPNTIIKTIAEVPITPAEAILKSGHNMFPVVDLTERLNQIDNNPSEYDDTYVGELSINSVGNIEFKPSSKQPIRTFKNQDNKMEGAIEMYQLPEKDKSGKVFSNRYILSCDPYDNDQAESKSLGSIFVLDLWTDRIVAEYTGRPMFADDFYEIARKMTLFYDGRMNYENNKKGLFAYFQRMNGLYLLTDSLEFLRDKELSKARLFGNNTKGTTATAGINSYARLLLRNWLLQPITMTKKSDTDEQIEIIVPKLFTLKSRALIEELIGYNDLGNFDRVSSMLMLMLLREDKMIKYNGNLLGSKKEIENDYLGNDPFFKNNYRVGLRNTLQKH